MGMVCVWVSYYVVWKSMVCVWIWKIPYANHTHVVWFAYGLLIDFFHNSRHFGKYCVPYANHTQTIRKPYYIFWVHTQTILHFDCPYANHTQTILHVMGLMENIRSIDAFHTQTILFHTQTILFHTHSVVSHTTYANHTQTIGSHTQTIRW